MATCSSVSIVFGENIKLQFYTFLHSLLCSLKLLRSFYIVIELVKMRICMVFFFVLLLREIEANSKLPDGLKGYEKVIPKEVGTHSLNSTHERFDPAIREFLLSTKDRTFHLILRKQTNIASDYFSIITDKRASKEKVSDLNQCHYHGRLEEGGNVVMSICEGLRGCITDTNNEVYFIEPLGVRDEHIFYKLENVILDKGSLPRYFFGNEKNTKHRFKRIRRSSYSKQSLKYIPMAIVADHSFYKSFKHDEAAVVGFIFSILNYVNHIYSAINIKIVLTNLEIWTINDRVNITDNAIVTLNNFHQYHRDVLIKEKGWIHHHNAHLLSGKHLGGLVGLSRSNTLCKGLSEAMTTVWHPNPYFVAGAVAHELAHNIGIRHFGKSCRCTASHCLMSTHLSLRYLVDGLTECTKQSFHEVCRRGSCRCMLSSPKQILDMKTKCGNGYVEEGEECDCGPVKLCQNKCCNATTCKLIKNAQCADGKCCNTDLCTFIKVGTTCRNATDVCDVTERCSGKDKECPLDVTVADFSPCKKETGYCYKGKCSPTLQQQCQNLWGKEANYDEKNCLRRTQNVNEFYNCGKAKNGSFIPCKPKDAICGKLTCVGNKLPVFPKIGTSRKTTYYYGKNGVSCRLSSVFVYDMPDPTIAAQATKCGDGKVCYNHECVDVNTLQKSKCHGLCRNGKGICTNQNACYCYACNGGSSCSRFDGRNLRGKLYYPSCRNQCKNGGICDWKTEKCFCPAGTSCPSCNAIDPTNTRGRQCYAESPKGLTCNKFGFHGFFTKQGCRANVEGKKKSFVLLGSFRNVIDWKYLAKSMDKILCQCATMAKIGGYRMFGIQYWGECWASRRALVKLKSSTDCFNSTYKKCEQRSKTCVGTHQSIFLYKII